MREPFQQRLQRRSLIQRRRPALRRDVEEDQWRRILPEVVDEHFPAAVSTDGHSAGETLLNTPSLIEVDQLFNREQHQIVPGGGNKTLHAALTREELAVVLGQPNGKVPLDLRDLLPVSTHADGSIKIG
jgi:hypothetical protein